MKVYCLSQTNDLQFESNWLFWKTCVYYAKLEKYRGITGRIAYLCRYVLNGTSTLEKLGEVFGTQTQESHR